MATNNNYNKASAPETALQRYYRLKNERQYKTDTAQQQTVQPVQETPAEEQNKGGFLGGIGYGLEKLGLGIVRGLEGVADYIVAGGADLFGQDEYAEKVMTDDWMNYNHADEWYNPSEGWQTVGDITGSIGQMLPSVAAAAIPYVGPALSTGMFMTSAAGNAVSEAAKESGELGGKEWLYGSLSGAAEGAVEKVSGGIGGSKLGQVLGKQLGKTTLGKLGVTFAGEGLEEVASDLIDPALRRVTGVDKDATVDWEQLPKTFLVGGAAGSVMGAGTRAVNAARVGGFNNLNAIERTAAVNEGNAELNRRAAQGRNTERSEAYVTDMRKRLERSLKKMDADTRARFFAEHPTINNTFNADGSMKKTAQVSNPAAVSAAYRNAAPSYYRRTQTLKNGNTRTLTLTPTKKTIRPEVQTALNDAVRLTDGRINYVVTDNIGKDVNGFYDRDSGTIYISSAAGAQEAARAIVSHEITHTLEGTKEYAALAEYALESMAGREEYSPGRYLTAYAEAHPNVNADTLKYIVDTERVADYIGKELLSDEQTVRRLVESHESIARRIYNWIKDKLAILTKRGGDRETARELSRALKLYENALRHSVGGVSLDAVQAATEARNARTERTGEREHNAKRTLTPATQGGRYSIRAIDGESVVVIDTDQDIFEGADVKDYPKIVRKYMLDKFQGKIFPVGTSRAYVNRRGIEEYAYSANRRQDQGTRAQKMRAGTELDNLLKVGEYIRHEADDGRHPDATRGWDYYKTRFTFDGENIYEGIISIKLIDRGDLFYDITKIENTSAARAAGIAKGNSSASDRGASTTSIAQKEDLSTPGAKKDEKVRYSVKIGEETVSGTAEETGTLVALHNLSEEKLLKVLELGGFPMPSIAVTTPELAHDDFGDITVVFGRETIDPQRDSRNKVFSRDAWTPTVPRAEYKPNEKVLDKISKKYYELARGKGNYDLVRPLYKYVNDMERQLENSNGEAGMLAELYEDTDVMQMYLLDTTGQTVEPIYTETTEVMPEADVIRSEALIEELGESLTEPEYLMPPAMRKYIAENKERILDALGRAYAQDWGEAGNTEKIAEGRKYYEESKTDTDLAKYLSAARRYHKEGKTRRTREYNSSATREAIRKRTDQGEYRKWVDSLFKGIEEKRGIRNDKDPYTASGNRRSFEATHYEYTLENIVEAMRSDTQKGGNNWVGLSPAVLAAKLSKEFKSVADMKKNAEALTGLTAEARDNFNETARKMLDEIAGLMVRKSQDTDTVSTWDALDSAQAVIGEIADKRLFTEPEIAAYMRKEYGKTIYNYNAEIGNKILGLFAYVKQLTQTDYFEAKPRRAVGFDEIRTVLLPESASAKLRKALDDCGIPYQEYASGQSRSAVVKSLDNVRFSLATDSEGRKLTEEQAEYFSQSKITDAEGRLLSLYHGSNAYEEIHVFRRGKNGYLGGGIYLTDSESYARKYADKNGYKGRIYNVYADARNPLEVSTNTPAKEILRAIYGSDKVYDRRVAAQNYETQLISSTDIRKLREKGYDAIVWRFGGDTEVSVFEPNQIKLTTNKTPTSNSDIRYSLAKPFAEQVDDVLAGRQSQTIDLYVSETPDVFVELGFPKTPMLMRSSKVKEILAKHTEMSVELIKQIPEAIQNPLFVLKSKTNPDVSVVAITEIMTEQGELVVPVWINQDGVYLDIDLDKPVALKTNFVASAYGRNVKGLLEYALNNDGILYVNPDKEKVDKLLTRHGLQLPRPLRIADSSISIRQETENVNGSDAKNEKVRYSVRMSQSATEAERITAELTDRLRNEYHLNAAEVTSISAVVRKDVQAALAKKNMQKGLYTHLYKKFREKYWTEIRTRRYRNSILNTARTARDMLNRKGYVSARVLENEDLKGYLKFVANLKGGADIKADVRERVAALKKVYNKDNFALYDENAITGSELDENIVAAIDLVAENAGSKAALTADELRAIDVITKGLVHLYKNYDLMWRGDSTVSVRETADRGVEVLQATARRRQRNTVWQWIKNRINAAGSQMLEPTSVMRQLDSYADNGVMTELFEDVKRGEIEAAVNELHLLQPLEAFYKAHKGYKKRLTDTKVRLGDAEITLDEAMYVYLLSFREQAHLSDAGVTVTDKNGFTRKISGDHIHIGDIESAFNADDKAYVELMRKLFNEDARDLKTETDRKLYGYTVLEDGDNYVPIYRDRAGIAMRMGDPKGYLNDVATAFNLSFNKATVKNAKLPISLYGITEVAARHARGIGIYSGLTIPIKNFNRVYNNVTDERPTSMRETMNHRVWNGAEAYLKKLFNDIQGVGRSTSAADRALTYVRGVYAKYQLGANIKTVLSQTASYPMAFVYLDADCLTRAFAMKPDKAAMFEYAPMTEQRMTDRAVVKAQSLSDRIGRIGDLATKPIQMMDNAVVRRLWAASQLHVEKHTGHKVGTEANLRAAGELLTKVVRETQSNYLTTERSAMNRSNNFLVSSLTMFMSDATKQFSRLFDAVGELSVRRDAFRAEATEANRTAYRQAQKKLGRAVTAVTVSNLHYVLMGLLVKFLFNRIEDDDKDGSTVDEYLKDFGKEFGGSMLGLFPVVRDVYGYFTDGFELNNYALGMLNDMLKATKSMGTLAGDILSGKPMETSEMMRPIRELLYAVGMGTGIPVRNIYNLVYGLVKRFDPATAYKANALFYDNTAFKADIQYAQEQGNTRLAEAIAHTETVNRTGWDDTAVVTEVSRLLGAGYSVLPGKVGETLTVNGVEQELTGKQQKALQEAYNASETALGSLFRSSGYAALDDAGKARAARYVQDYFTALGKSTVLGIAMPSKYYLYELLGADVAALHLSVIAGIEADKDKAGNTVANSRKSKVHDYIESQRLTALQKYILLILAGYKPAEAGKDQVRRAINRLSVSPDVKADLLELVD